MTNRENSPVPSAVAPNPFLTLWAMPLMMTHAWMSMMLCMTKRHDAVSRNGEKGQIPVPPNLQDSKDRELFA